MQAVPATLLKNKEKEIRQGFSTELLFCISIDFYSNPNSTIRITLAYECRISADEG